MPSDSPDPAPRVSIEVSDPALRAQILAMLERAEVQISKGGEGGTLGASDGAGGDAENGGNDLVILPRAEFLKRRGTQEETDEERGVLVVSDRDDPADRARLIAAGAQGVLPTDLTPSELTEVIADHATRPDSAVATRGVEDLPRLTDFSSRDPMMMEFLDAVWQVVDTETPLLVLGETGVGKERLARAIHAEGPRSPEPFVAVNCGALPATLLETELFGHEEGAFTGASERRRGRFERAGKGTIFLDEVGDMPPSLQVRLLDVLQRREIQPLGAEDPTTVEARVIAATHRDLQLEVEKGQFREDLFYRLHVMPLRLPPLRERPDGLPELIGRLLRSLRVSLDRPSVESISRDALEKLLDHDWPGNVRELGNVLERAILVADDRKIRARDLMFARRAGEDTSRAGTRTAAAARPASGSRGQKAATPTPPPPYKDARAELLEQFDREYFVDLLEECAGRIGQVAERAGIAERTVYEKLRKLGLDKSQFRR